MTVSKKLILSHCPYSHVDRLCQASVFPVSTFMDCGRAYTEIQQPRSISVTRVYIPLDITFLP